MVNDDDDKENKIKGFQSGKYQTTDSQVDVLMFLVWGGDPLKEFNFAKLLLSYVTQFLNNFSSHLVSIIMFWFGLFN